MTVPANFDPDAILMTGAEVAVALRVSERHLRNLVVAGRVPPPAMQGNKCNRWTRAQLERWAASLTSVPEPAVA